MDGLVMLYVHDLQNAAAIGPGQEPKRRWLGLVLCALVFKKTSDTVGKALFHLIA